MNYSNFLVKILKKPKQIFFKENILVTKLLVQFPSTSNRKTNFTDVFSIYIWGSLSTEAMKYYNINDYIMIEGFISLRKEKTNNYKHIHISVLKTYPIKIKGNLWVSKN